MDVSDNGHRIERVITPSALDGLITELARRGHTVIGPTVRDRAIVYAEISSVDDLPGGWTDEQDGGRYRLRRRDDEALFGFNVGPNSWKSHLFPATLTLWKSRRDDQGGLSFEAEPSPPRATPFIGVRSCDLAAVAIQDRVFDHDAYRDADYQARRRDAFIVVVNCGKAGGTCFCVSMNTGPRAELGFDLALTELLDGEHRFAVEVGSDRGAEVLDAIAARPASETDAAAADQVSEHCAAQMGRELETDGIKELLYRNLEHPRWDEVADRCLTCGNCTLVCPTCFCTPWRRQATCRGPRRRGFVSSTPASASITPTSTAAAFATRRSPATGNG